MAQPEKVAKCGDINKLRKNEPARCGGMRNLEPFQPQIGADETQKLELAWRAKTSTRIEGANVRVAENQMVTGHDCETGGDSGRDD